ncbi:Sulfurtransferase TusA [Koleobacter methoxysyntrophicus]|uniref:Sulfurtransferase TusA n=1 Tax=Koleobacter methoxysyntrophicus TaxID=2751313 RepID=A0A8A0RJY6_9FIRM|nr:sulfurtransferase-like selenium metabolism protein YedF [Koleobacter methoxysyntrophicus]QSQ08655.1 Sulfurtransferase TusA [Koleobacter methoxysyntrophicus]
MEKQVDARGLACPQPVVITKKALEEIEKGKVVVIVDSEVARDNLVKLAKSLDCSVNVEESNGDYHINILKGEAVGLSKMVQETNGDFIILVTSQYMGKGSDELGGILMKGFFYALSESYNLPQAVIFMNSGVKLTVEGTEVLESLSVLESKGVEILSCGTCLDYFNLKDKLVKGGVTNMYTIVERLNEAKKVITI